MKRPTPKQATRLRLLASGSTVLAPTRRAWGALLRHGWVEHSGASWSPSAAYLPPLRITPDGLRALAAAWERDGHPAEGASA